MDFEPIESQEALDKIIKERLERERKKINEQYKDYKSPDDLQKINDDFQAQITALNEKFKDYDEIKEKNAKYETDSVKTRIALEMGLPIEMVDRLKGETEEDIKKDAETLKKFAGSNVKVPLASNEIVKSKEDIEKENMHDAYLKLVKH